METKHTPGPWRWEINRRSKTIELVGGRPRFDKIVMDFERWGISGAAPRFNAEITGDELNIMFRVSDRADWIAPFPGRDHHADWCASVIHPDARLIEAAPDLLAALKAVVRISDRKHDAWDAAHAAIAKAEGK